ncbi:hypothetical protein LUZ63_014817 [Rhynchospora breviuscula]|uniref:Protein kinase domain-containing protein n=1 Tax=Rhynchospora breviuscula TaxID=2022672 RepID=A0A9Q0CB72_9POAL|nr:hypothetical protein LUZ63_014817 [Rhynchospora breviuscula]
MLPIHVFIFFFLHYQLQFAVCNKHDTGFFDKCKPSRCSESGPEIRFPYRLYSSPEFCGVPGMELTCSSNGDTVLYLPNLNNNTKVLAIDYKYGYLTIELGNSYNCLLQNLSTVNLTSTLYSPRTETISLLTCPTMFIPNTSFDLTGPVTCLSGIKSYIYVVSVTESMDKIPPECMVVRNNVKFLGTRCLKYFATEPPSVSFQESVDDFLIRRLVRLDWSITNDTQQCLECENRGRRCGYDLTINKAFCKPRDRNIKAISAVSVTVVVLLFTATAGMLYVSRNTNKERETRLRVERFLATYRITKPTRYTFRELKKVTKQFRDKLGQGGFGSVYKGELRNGLPVAVKMLERSKGNGEDFINEVATIGRIHHFNIVRLLGFCSEGTRRALVYEFMPNESLEKYITVSKNGTHPLKLEKLLQISIGIARGIEYLHQGCTERILHFDIKPHNILLDENMNPKIADFGLAKLCAKDQSIISMTAARGTMGYIAPEVYSRNFGTVSYKSDVYSFGMLLLEMVGGRKCVEPKIEMKSEDYFPEMVYDRLLVDGQVLNLGVHLTLSESKIAKKILIVAFWCIQWNPVVRPSMTAVLHMLINDFEDLEMPPKPFVSSLGLCDNIISEEV